MGVLLLALGSLQAVCQIDTAAVKPVARDSVQKAPTAKKAYLDDPVIYPAKDSTVIDMIEKKIRMYGKAKITYQNMEITADYIEMSIDRKELFATGIKDSTGKINGRPVTFKNGEETLEVKELKYNFATRKAFVVDVAMKQEPEGFLHSQFTKRDSSGTLYIRDGKYTTCDKDEPDYYFDITKGIMVPNKMIVTGPLFLVVEGIPIYLIGLPFGYLPKPEKKSSGILMPKYGEEKNRGFFLRDGGYYFSINDRMDLSLTGSFYSKGSWALGAQSRYRKIYRYNGSVGLNFATNITGEKGLPNYQPTKDWSVTWSHAQDPKANPFNNFNASVNMSSSSYDRNNTYTDFTNPNQNPLERLTNQKSSSVTYSRKFTNKLFNFTAKLGHSQNSIDKSVALNVPSGTFTVGRFYPFRWNPNSTGKKWYEKIEMRYTSTFENKIKTREDSILTPDIFTKMRSGFKQEVPVSASFKILRNMTFTPSLNYQGILFFNHIEKTWDPSLDSIIINRINQLQYIQTLAPNVSLSFTPRLYGFYTFKKGRLKAIRHVMSPSLNVGYRPDLGYDFSKYQRTLVTMEPQNDTTILKLKQTYSIFDGSIYQLPSVAGKYGNISFGLSNQLDMKVLDPKDTTGTLKKVKLLDNLSLGTSYDIFRDSMNLAPIQLNARTTVMDKLNLSFSSTFNPYAIDSVTRNKVTYYQTVNVFEITRSGRPARLTNANFSLGFSLPINKNQSDGGRNAGGQGLDRGGNPSAVKNKWHLQVDYNLLYSKPFLKSTVTQSLRLGGSLSLTTNWTVEFTSGYDFVNNQMTYTTLTISRDLHCWRMNINVVPFGQYKSYTFGIYAKGSLLKDVKYEKTKNWRDQLQ